MEGFLMSAAVAEEFFTLCIEREAITQSERMTILKELVNKRKAFPQTGKQIQKRMNGKKVLVVKKGDK